MYENMFAWCREARGQRPDESWLSTFDDEVNTVLNTYSSY